MHSVLRSMTDETSVRFGHINVRLLIGGLYSYRLRPQYNTIVYPSTNKAIM